MDKRKIQYLQNYATLKARGIVDPEYTLVIHKGTVRAPGYEYLTDFEKEEARLERINAEFLKRDNVDVLKERFVNSIVRSRSNVVQLGANNPWEYFVTLSLKRDSAKFDAYDLKSVKKVLLEFLSDYGRRSGKEYGFKYLLIPEMHKDGAWHFHGFMMGINPKDLVINENGYLDFLPYRKRFGWVSFGRSKDDNEAALGDSLTAGRILDLQRSASYITKYITKDMFGSEVHDNTKEHLYFASKGLNKDTTVVVGELTEEIETFKKKGYEVRENEFCAKIPVDLETGLDSIQPYDMSPFEVGVNIPGTQPKEVIKKLRDINIFKSLRQHASRPVASVTKLSDLEVLEMKKIFSSHDECLLNVNPSMPVFVPLDGEQIAIV